MALVSSVVASSDDATYTQYNNLRQDVTQHTHEGTDTALLKADSIKTVTGNRTLTLPTGADDTLVTLTAAQTMSNKKFSDTVYINESANAGMTLGLTINQGGADNEILAFKSSDVAHGVLTNMETDTFGMFRKIHATEGGLAMYASSLGTNEKRAIQLTGSIAAAAADTTKSTSAVGVVNIGASVNYPAAALGANENILVLGKGGAADTCFIFDSDGDGHADVAWTTYAKHDDLALLADIEAELLRREDVGQTVRRRYLEEVGVIGKGSWHFENGRQRAMVNFTKGFMLHHGSLLAVGRTIFAMCEELGITERVKQRLGGHNVGMLQLTG